MLKTASLLVAMGILLAACATPTPVPSPPASASSNPITTAPPRATPSPGPSPEITCQPPPDLVDPTLACASAVEAALAALPAGMSEITRIEFHFGPYCPIWARCARVPSTNDGYVIVLTEDASQSVYVSVHADRTGMVSLTSDFASYPPPAPTGTTSRRVDPSITPVSLSHPPSGAAEALRICQVGDLIGADVVSGFGEVPHARDAVRYSNLTGAEPELRTDAPAWLVQVRGEVPMLTSGEVWIDPTCIVVDGNGGWYATGPVRDATSGVLETAPSVGEEPDLSLPAPLR